MLLVLIITALAVYTLSIGRARTQDLYTIEMAPALFKNVTEHEKWELKTQGKGFLDVTLYPELQQYAQLRAANVAPTVTYPEAAEHTAAVKALLPSLDKDRLKTILTTFSDFFNRYYNFQYGVQSSEWLLEQISNIILASNARSTFVKPFEHPWPQSSIIATIPGKSNKTIIISAHQDSININFDWPEGGRAPGADDDGSGSMTILEALRVILSVPQVAAGEALNTLEFHWYAAEEAGMLGSQAIFTDYRRKQKDVRAMMHQDMTGYVKPETTASIGIFTDYVDPGLTTFIEKMVVAYCKIPYVESTCGYGCSDHVSAWKAGYPSSLVSESAFENTLGDDILHTSQDTMENIDLDHMLEHAKLVVGFAYELAFATL